MANMNETEMRILKILNRTADPDARSVGGLVAILSLEPHDVELALESLRRRRIVAMRRQRGKETWYTAGTPRRSATRRLRNRRSPSERAH